jgi:hypothetical protein
MFSLWMWLASPESSPHSISSHPGWRWLLSGVATCGLVLTGAWAHATPAQVILIRHGDKDSQRGDYNLSPRGFDRALRLGRMIPACFGTPNQIRTFELDPVSSKNSRSYQTAVPLAVATGVNIGIGIMSP